MFIKYFQLMLIECSQPPPSYRVGNRFLEGNSSPKAMEVAELGSERAQEPWFSTTVCCLQDDWIRFPSLRPHPEVPGQR